MPEPEVAEQLIVVWRHTPNLDSVSVFLEFQFALYHWIPPCHLCIPSQNR